MEGDMSISRAAGALSFTRGVHHLALCTDDMKGTVEFYTRVLGMPLVHAMRTPAGTGTGPKNRGNPPYEEIRHYFFDMGNDSLLAFFEIPKGQQPAANRNAIGAIQHCAFVVTPARFAEIEERLKRHKLPYHGPLPQLPGLLGIYIYDPNGIRLEFACQPGDGDAPRVIECSRQTREQARGELESLAGVDAGWVGEMSRGFGGARQTSPQGHDPANVGGGAAPAAAPQRSPGGETLYREVEDFLYAEAELLDEWRLEEWLALFTEDCRYLIPPGDLPPDVSPESTLFYIADDRILLRERVRRLAKRNAHAEQPHSRTRHMLSNIRIKSVSDDGQIDVRCAFLTHRERVEVVDTFIGSAEYRLVRDGGNLRIREKRCRLDTAGLREQGRISILL